MVARRRLHENRTQAADVNSSDARTSLPSRRIAPKVVFLESLQGVESLFTRGLRIGALQNGWETQLLFLRDTHNNPQPSSVLQERLRAARPDRICFLMDAPAEWPDLWDDDTLRKAPKISCWFDDFFRSPRTLSSSALWDRWQADCEVKVFMWDGHWRARWREHTGHEATPIHLAADHLQIRPDPPSLPELEDHAVMIGTIPSAASLDQESEALPAPIRRLLNECTAEMQRAPWPIRPYEIRDAATSALPAKMAGAVHGWIKEPVRLALLNRQLWRWGKRIARLRGLAAITQTGPVALLSGHGTELFAGDAEIRRELKPGCSLIFMDISRVLPSRWGGLFASGRFQFQVTDPQSVQGGIPFRVFECGASAATLLTDSRPELSEVASHPSECIATEDASGLAREAARLRTMTSEEIHQIGVRLHERFLREHTWKIRWGQLVSASEQTASPSEAATKLKTKERSTTK